MGSFFRFDASRLANGITSTGRTIEAFAVLAKVNHTTVRRALRGEPVHIAKALAIVQAVTTHATEMGQSLLALQAESKSS